MASPENESRKFVKLREMAQERRTGLVFNHRTLKGYDPSFLPKNMRKVVNNGGSIVMDYKGQLFNTTGR